MIRVTNEELIALQSQTEKIRNISIIAHVDHGKTTLSDCLISTNGIISSKSAGKIRYLDYTQEEQERGITMKSSSIALLHEKAVPQTADSAPKTSEDQNGDKNVVNIPREKYLVNLIDSPGHVDFTSEVGSALRVSDGAVLIVDVIEGVCIQTKVVLRSAWMERLKVVLVLNKMDKLIEQLNMDPIDAYNHIKKILETVNQLAGSLRAEDEFKNLELKLNATNRPDLADEDLIMEKSDEEELKDEEVYFSPLYGNVVFASSYHGWGFKLDQFCALYARKLGMRKSLLEKTLWGDFYLNPKTKKVYNKPPQGQSKALPLFAQLVLKNIWDVYNAVKMNRDQTKIEKIVKALELQVSDKELRNEDSNNVLQSVMTRWLPISKALLDMVVDQIPDPRTAQKIRIPGLWRPIRGELSDAQKEQTKKLKQDMLECNPNGEIVAFVSKVFSVKNDHLIDVSRPRVPPRRDPNAPKTEEPAQQPRAPLDPEGHTLIALARIFSGTLKQDSTVHVLGPKYNPLNPSKFHNMLTVKDIFMLMGRGLVRLTSVPAGCVFGIALPAESNFIDRPIGDANANNGAVANAPAEPVIVKTATLSSVEVCNTMEGIKNQVAPIIRVAVEPESPSDLLALLRGMKLLNLSDPGVMTYHEASGEMIVAASGEVHLNHCLKDLGELYAKVPFKVSTPLVPFRETITAEFDRLYIEEFRKEEKAAHGLQQQQQQAKRDQNEDAVIDLSNASHEPRDKTMTFDITASTANKHFTITVTSRPLPKQITDFLEANGDRTRRFVDRVRGQSKSEQSKITEEYRSDLLQAFKAAGPEWEKEVDSIWAFGPHRVGANVLLNKIPFYSTSKYWKTVAMRETETQIAESEVKASEGQAAPTDSKYILKELQELQQLDNSIVTGFQLATQGAPLCEEPMMGVAFVVTDIKFAHNEEADDERHGPFAGQVISTVKEACRKSFARHSQRLVEVMYLCDLMIDGSENLGKAYGVLSKRRADILREEIKEGSYVYSVQALLPAVESIGFVEDMFAKTSGAAHSQLQYWGWKVLNEDPNFVPLTEEEIEQYGDNIVAIGVNIARKHVDAVRRRKGLPVKERMVDEGGSDRKSVV